MKYKPGEKCPKNCECGMYNKNGHMMNTVSMHAGDTFPPTTDEGGYYEL